MRQVPKTYFKYSYLIVGNGKLSKHLQNYFILKLIPFYVITRETITDFKSYASLSQKILVVINDDQIEEFILTHKDESNKDKTWIHCSGSLSTQLAESAHPLMTFTDDLYDLKTYERIPFITERGRKNFKELFPELNNPEYSINPDDKLLYHTLCVTSGNFTTILWQYFFNFLKSKDIPQDAAYEFLRATTNNLINSKNPLTGPLQRKDRKIISSHLNALEYSSMKDVYLAMLELYNEMDKEAQIEINK